MERRWEPAGDQAIDAAGQGERSFDGGAITIGDVDGEQLALRQGEDAILEQGGAAGREIVVGDQTAAHEFVRFEVDQLDGLLGVGAVGAGEGNEDQAVLGKDTKGLFVLVGL
jgi:hypothetical protein